MQLLLIVTAAPLPAHASHLPAEFLRLVLVVLDPGGNPGPGRCPGGEMLAPPQLEFPGGLPGLDDRVIEGRAGPAHWNAARQGAATRKVGMYLVIMEKRDPPPGLTASATSPQAAPSAASPHSARDSHEPGNPGRFIHAGESGPVSGWNPQHLPCFRSVARWMLR